MSRSVPDVFGMEKRIDANCIGFPLLADLCFPILKGEISGWVCPVKSNDGEERADPNLGGWGGGQTFPMDNKTPWVGKEPLTRSSAIIATVPAVLPRSQRNEGHEVIRRCRAVVTQPRAT